MLDKCVDIRVLYTYAVDFLVVDLRILRGGNVRWSFIKVTL